MLEPSSRMKFIVSGVLSLIILGGVFSAGVFIGVHRRAAIERVTGIASKETKKPSDVDFSLFWETWAELQEKFVDADQIDVQKEVYGAIAGMVRSLGDPYTVFFPPAENKQFQQELKGEFGGIGAELGIRKGILTVITPLKGSPAERAGLKAGDKIAKINSTTTEDISLEAAVQMIRGEKGTPVTLTVFRDSFETAQEIKIVRDTIVVPVIDTKDKGDGIFYIHLLSFNEASPRAFRDAVREFTRSQNRKIILDLRGNAGGFLNAAVDIASWFLPAGETVARERYADGSEDLYRSNGYGVLEGIPVVVLIDQGSASASEILAGALRDIRGIPLMGATSFGKGSVQELVDLPKGASVKITIAKWLTPKGANIDSEGLEPDVSVEVTEKDTDEGKDPQLEKAIEILKTK